MLKSLKCGSCAVSIGRRQLAVLVGRRADAGDAVQAVQQLLERAQPLRDLGADLLDEQIELVDVRQLPRHQETLVISELPEQCPLHS